MGADETRNALLNVGGTQNAIDLANALEVGTFHHMSSIAVAGLYDEGTFNEDMFDEGQKLAHPYHRTKFESEKLVRERVKSPCRDLPPVASSSATAETGEMDKIDGPVLLLQGDPEGPAHAAGVVPADHRSSGAGRTSSRSTTSPPRSTTSPTRPASTARPSTSSTRRASASARC